jgi:hypothetical protein
MDTASPREPVVDDVVRLTNDVPYLNLHKGMKGVVRSLWKGPRVAYEVEFLGIGLDELTRAVLMRDQLSLEGEDRNMPSEAWDDNSGQPAW